MPNWCSNSLTVEGDPKDVAAFLHAAGVEQSEDGVYLTDVTGLFDKFVPMPSILSRIHRGSITIDGEKFAAWITVERDGEKVNKPVTELELDLLQREHGAVDWYDWSINNWGCKWDTEASVGWVERLPEKHTARLTFDTAWAPPIEWVTKVAPRYPLLHFTLAYAEVGSGFIGTHIWAGGRLIDHDEWSGDFMREGWDWEAAIEEGLDVMDGLRPNVADHLETYDLGMGG